MEEYDSIFHLLSSSDYYKLDNQALILVNNKDFMKCMIKVPNPWLFDRFIKMLEYKTDTSLLHEERKKYLKKVIFSSSNNKKLEYLKNVNVNNFHRFLFTFDEISYLEHSKNNFNYALNKISNRWLIEYIISYFFQDNYYNFMTNLFQMINYLKTHDRDLINHEHIKMYNGFVDIKNASFQDKIGVFKLYLNDNLLESFYDDISVLKNDAHHDLVEHVTKLYKGCDIYQKDISDRLKIDVYHLDGQPFYGFVRCLSIKITDQLVNTNYLLSKENRLGYSFSYISHNNIGTSDYAKNHVTLYYDDIDYHNIMYVHHSDLHTGIVSCQNKYLSVKENEILSATQLIAKTKNYNEVYIKSSSEGIRPKALVCYNKISINDISFAKKHNLVILIINTNKYKYYETFDDDYLENSYMI